MLKIKVKDYIEKQLKLGKTLEEIKKYSYHDIKGKFKEVVNVKRYPLDEIFPKRPDTPVPFWLGRLENTFTEPYISIQNANGRKWVVNYGFDIPSKEELEKAFEEALKDFDE
jgi:hypothetical protein